MNWKHILLPAVGATLGTVGVHTYFNGLDMILLALVSGVSFFGAVFIAYLSTLGKNPNQK